MAISLFDFAQEGVSGVGFSSLATSMEGLTVDVNEAAIIESTITEDFSTYMEYSQECFDELNRRSNEFAATEAVAAIRYVQATSESSRALVTEALKERLGDMWDHIKAFLAKAWAAIKAYCSKFADFLKKRYELVKAMMTKYGSVLAQKKVDDSIDFNWCDNININDFVQGRKTWIDKALNPFGTDLTNIIDEIKKAGNSQNLDGIKQSINDWEKKWHAGPIMSTQIMASEMNNKLYGKGNKGPVYVQKKWSQIGAEAIKLADTKYDTLVSEALGLYEREVGDGNRIVDSAKKVAIEFAKEDMGAEGAVLTGVKKLVTNYANGIKKVNDMYIRRLQTGINQKQTLAITACRKAITAKGTKDVNESSFMGMESVII